MKSQNDVKKIRYYYVDEGGDCTLFSRNGKVIIETPGCSRFFILGLLDIPDPQELRRCFHQLRDQLISDSYFKSVPSMQKENQKTALAFHATDDLPEVRKEVFNALLGVKGLKFHAVVTDKFRVLEYVRFKNSRFPKYHYNPNELYDFLVKRLFKNHLHKDNGYEITFALRGNSDRTKALGCALETARKRFDQQFKTSSTSPIHVSSSLARNDAGLQAVDYFIWAIQRLFEKQEDRYVEYLWPAIKLIQDIDDTRKAGYGMYYSQKHHSRNQQLSGEQEKKNQRI